MKLLEVSGVPIVKQSIFERHSPHRHAKGRAIAIVAPGRGETDRRHASVDQLRDQTRGADHDKPYCGDMTRSHHQPFDPVSDSPLMNDR